MTFYRRYGKRGLDVVLVLLSVPIVVPVLLMGVLAVYLSMGRPIFFIQSRPGFKNGIFNLVKLRTMWLGLDGDDKRMTGVGRILRNLSMDELPSLWNVLRGDMSLVGPRPLLVQYLERYSPEQARRHEVQPGLTGLAQVSGRNLLLWESKFKLDVEYVETLSFRLDISILAQTVFKVISRHGVSHPDSVTMPEFRGQSSC